ncbi:hypothetical protein K438DRAFT_1993190 [Mycena galopus ATCC 62051]|nr:hypothetical protein K438DRAFT_1993190 [Mycena galopus ATCC 62051]
MVTPILYYIHIISYSYSAYSYLDEDLEAVSYFTTVKPQTPDLRTPIGQFSQQSFGEHQQMSRVHSASPLLPAGGLRRHPVPAYCPGASPTNTAGWKHITVCLHIDKFQKWRIFDRTSILGRPPTPSCIWLSPAGARCGPQTPDAARLSGVVCAKLERMVVASPFVFSVLSLDVRPGGANDSQTPSWLRPMTLLPPTLHIAMRHYMTWATQSSSKNRASPVAFSMH